MTKKQHEEAIRHAIEKAVADGYTIVVATDPEGNSYSTLNPKNMIYDGTSPKYIALGVWRENVEESLIFNEQ